MNLDLEGKVFYIAGSSRGIGLGIAQCFLDEGACVVLTGRDKHTLNEVFEKFHHTYPGKVLALAGDLCEKDIISSHLKETCDHFGAIHGIVANVGNGRSASIFPEGDHMWEESYRMNLESSLLLGRMSFEYLQRTSGSTLTFISSIAGLEDLGAPVPYSIYKSAIHSASKILSRQYASKGVRVNTVAPGNIFFKGGSWEKKFDKDPTKVDAYIQREVPLKKFGEPEDIGHICCFLASDKSRFITGSVIVADGGQTRSY